MAIDNRQAQSAAPDYRPIAEHSPAVADAIADRLRRQGRLTFAEFMALALYLPEAGYYAAAESLPQRDYRTSPLVHPAFGTLIAWQLEQMWRVLGAPCRFAVVEAGAGDGTLCRDVLACAAHLAPQFAHALQYVIVEPNLAAVRRQRATLPPDAAGRVHWVTGSALALPVADVVGCFLSHELVDAFPVHRVVLRGGVLYESYVIARDGAFVETLAEPSTPALGHYFARLGLQPPEGCLGEVNLCAEGFIREAAAALARGFLLTIDYGLAADELFSARRPAGTLRCYHHHLCHADPYRALGRQDITAHVDFSTLVIAGREAGLRLTGLSSQREFLLNLGIEAFAHRLERASVTAGQRYDNKFALQELISSAGLGAFRVLIQHKGLHDPELDAFNPCNDRKRLMQAGDGPSFLPLL